MIRKGEPWGSKASGPPDLEVHGDDAALALRGTGLAVGPRRVPTGPGWRSRPGRRADGDSPRVAELPIDALAVAREDAEPRIGINAVVLGKAPDRLTRWTRSQDVEVRIDDRHAWSGRAGGVVVANGQFLRGSDIVPRGHPGDGRVEIHVYTLRRGERSAMRRRLATGTHLPHPRIVERRGHVVEICAAARMPLEVDGVPWAPAERVRVAVLPGALRLLV